MYRKVKNSLAVGEFLTSALEYTTFKDSHILIYIYIYIYIIEITPHLGIGDIIQVKMRAISNNINIVKVNINKGIINTYFSDYETKTKFAKKFIELLFPSAIIDLNDKKPDFVNFIKQYPLKRVYLYDYLEHIKPSPNKYDNYICIHTKLRHDRLIDRTYSEIIPELIDFLKTFKTTKTIIITGEKNIGINLETKVHKTKSLYEELLLLKTNNIVIDLTLNELTEGNPDFDNFKQDIELINKSCCNITFGVGGPLLLCSAFSNKHIAMVPFLEISPHRNITMLLHINICQTVKELKDQMSEWCL